MSSSKQIKIPGLSFVDLIAAIGAFLLFDISLIGYPSLPPEIFVFWDLSSQPIFMSKIWGVFIYPLVALGAIVFAYVLPRSLSVVRLKSICYSIILGLHSSMLLQNFQVLQIDSKDVLVLLFSFLSLIAGTLILRQTPLQEEIVHASLKPQSEEQAVLAEIAKISDQQVEGWGLISIGAVFIPFGFQGDLLRVMSLSLFLVALLYGALYLLSLVKASQGVGGESAQGIVYKYQMPTIIMETPTFIEEEERTIPIKKKVKGHFKKKDFKKDSLIDKNPQSIPSEDLPRVQKVHIRQHD